MNARKEHWFTRAWHAVFPQVPDFQGMLVEQSRLLEGALSALQAFLEQAGADRAREVRRRVTDGRSFARSNLDRLHSTFITRIDREDIYLLITRVDHVFDYAETSARELEVLEVGADKWMKKMVAELQQGAAALTEGFQRFREHPEQAESCAARARRAERAVETLYRKALAEMFAGKEYRHLVSTEDALSGKNCVEFLVDRIKRREVYRHLSNAADRLAHAGEALHDVSVKYG